MDNKIKDAYIQILKNELIPAFGCTEPSAVAYCAAKVVNVLGSFPKHIDIYCSGNIIKNVKGVIVPNSGGLRGIDAAATLGCFAKNADNALEVLEQLSEKEIKEATSLLSTDFCKCYLQEGEGNLYIDITANDGSNTAQVTIRDSHTNITLIKHNDAVIFEKDTIGETDDISQLKKLLSVEGIVNFAKEANSEDLSQLKEILDYQIKVNTEIAEEGLINDYGASVGKTLVENFGNDIKVRAKAKAAAASDARMNGCSMPVVINSGSGNQGIVVTVPVVEYAKELGSTQEELYRALLISNLISIHIKNHIGKLSAFCGAVSAACGTGAAISYLYGGDLEEISETIINTCGNVGGIVCDGAKASCAAKIASSLDAAILGQNMAKKHRAFQSGEGLVTNDIEKTINNIGKLGKDGMKETDVEILNMMIQK